MSCLEIMVVFKTRKKCFLKSRVKSTLIFDVKFISRLEIKVVFKMRHNPLLYLLNFTRVLQVLRLCLTEISYIQQDLCKLMIVSLVKFTYVRKHTNQSMIPDDTLKKYLPSIPFSLHSLTLHSPQVVLLSWFLYPMLLVLDNYSLDQ